ncbi:MAG: hypothetical protein M1829_000920 [Trizodia sp. TS-e1964]|nr:MAG: hypothetical protein M1829_000920 [Trizodia sp. TS-e1964]
MSPGVLDSSSGADGNSAASMAMPAPSGLDLGILGLGTEYPPFQIPPDDLETLARRFHPDSPALSKVLMINQYTGIESRSAIGNIDHPLANSLDPPDIDKLSDFFLQEGVALSVKAARKAIAEWGGSVEEITHVVSTTCTNSANPGFDHYVISELGVPSSVEKVLLHGVGCSGGLAALRTAANLALGSSFQRKPARILIIACEISSLLVRSELDSIAKDQTTRIGVTLFSDCASAMVLGNGFGNKKLSEEVVYDLLGWKHAIIPDTRADLGFDVHPLGWKVVLTPRVPALASESIRPIFDDLLDSLPELHLAPSKKPALDTTTQNSASNGITNGTHTNGTTNGHSNGTHKSPHLASSLLPSDFDWALHPGGSSIITGVEKSLSLTTDHLRASYEIYMQHGNSSSATVISVMDHLRKSPGTREHVVACAFGPGIAVEMAVLKRRDLRGKTRNVEAAGEVDADGLPIVPLD